MSLKTPQHGTSLPVLSVGSDKPASEVYVNNLEDSMISRDRVIRTLNHQSIDRVARDLGSAGNGSRRARRSGGVERPFSK